jgi:hypothetical protein
MPTISKLRLNISAQCHFSPSILSHCCGFQAFCLLPRTDNCCIAFQHCQWPRTVPGYVRDDRASLQCRLHPDVLSLRQHLFPDFHSGTALQFCNTLVHLTSEKAVFIFVWVPSLASA